MSPEPMAVYPMARCLDGRHPPFNIEDHPEGCPRHATHPTAHDRVEAARLAASGLRALVEEAVREGYVSIDWTIRARAVLAATQDTAAPGPYRCCSDCGEGYCNHLHHHDATPPTANEEERP